MSRYGPRDSVSIVMARGHKLAYRWTGAGGRYWVMDGRRTTLAAIDDLADRYEPGCYRYTEPRARVRTRTWLRTFTGRDASQVVSSRVPGRRGFRRSRVPLRSDLTVSLHSGSL